MRSTNSGSENWLQPFSPQKSPRTSSASTRLSAQGQGGGIQGGVEQGGGGGHSQELKVLVNSFSVDAD